MVGLQLAQEQEPGLLVLLQAEEEVQLVHKEQQTQEEEVQQMAQQAAGTKRPLKVEGLEAGWQQTRKQERRRRGVPDREEGAQ